MKSVRTEIDIAAPGDRVFAVLADFSSWRDWNPVIPEIHGDLRPGGRVAFRIRIEGLPTLPIQAKLINADAGRKIAWVGGVRGFFWGEHYFLVESRGEATHLVHGEDFDGALVALMPRQGLARIERSYARLNEALRREVLRREARA